MYMYMLYGGRTNERMDGNNSKAVVHCHHRPWRARESESERQDKGAYDQRGTSAGIMNHHVQL